MRDPLLALREQVKERGEDWPCVLLVEDRMPFGFAGDLEKAGFKHVWNRRGRSSGQGCSVSARANVCVPFGARQDIVPVGAVFRFGDAFERPFQSAYIAGVRLSPVS